MSAPPAAAATPPAANSRVAVHRAGSDALFFTVMWGLGGSYIVLILALLVADIAFMQKKPDFQIGDAAKQQANDADSKSSGHFIRALRKPEIQYAIRLTLITCSISALLSILVAT